MNPFFSVIIPLYNKEKYIALTIERCLNQTFKDFEIIIVNDGSNDNSLELITSFNDKRIKIFSTENNGVSAARNLGISKSIGEYLVFLDADDFWEESFLEHMNYLILKFSNCQVFSCVRKIIPNNKPLIYQDIPKDKNHFEINYFKASKRNSILHCSSSVFSKKVINEIGLFNTNLITDEDTEYWIRLGLKYNILFSKKQLVSHTTYSNDLTHKKRKKYTSIDYEKYLKKSNNQDYLFFLNRNIYSSILKYKLSGNRKKSKELKKLLNKKLLSYRQKIIIKMPLQILNFLILINNKLSKEKLYY